MRLTQFDRPMATTPSGKAATPVRRRLGRDERRRLLLDAALHLFAERGYDHASVNNIAIAAGTTVSVLYDHFASKEELYATVLEEQWMSVLAEQGQRVMGAPRGYTRLRTAFDYLFEWFEQHPLAFTLIFGEMKGPPSVVAIHEQHLRRATAVIAGYLLGIDESESRHPALADPAVWIAAEWVKGGTYAVARWWYGNRQVTRDELVDRVMELSWTGFERLGHDGQLREALERSPLAGRPRRRTRA